MGVKVKKKMGKPKPFGQFSGLLPLGVPTDYVQRMCTTIGLVEQPMLKETLGLAVVHGIHINKGYRKVYGLWFDKRKWSELQAMRWWEENGNLVKFVK